MNIPQLVRIAVLLSSAVSIASAGKMIQPVGVASSQPVDPFANMGVVGDLASTIDQSGLDANYVAFETEFDEFTASAKTSATASPPSLGGIGPGLPGAIDFDLGSVYRIDAVAIWNQAGGEGSAALREFDLLASLTPDFANPTFIGSYSLPTRAEDEPVPADVYTFTNVPARYVRILATANRGFADATRINEFAVRRATLFTPSPADEQLSFFRNDPDSGYELHVINADGTGEFALRGDADYVTPPRWSPDGSRLIFSVDPIESNGEPDHESDVYSIEADGSGDSNLTNRVEDDKYPFWSPDGSRLVFESERNSNHEPSIYVMNADGSNVFGPLAPGRFPQWSPDGSSIAFANGTVKIVSPTGEDLVQLTPPSLGELDAGPVWSPDGSKLLFETFEGSESKIYVVNRDGSNLLQLAVGVIGDYPWSPDGRSLLFERDSDIFSVRPDGANEALVVDASAVGVTRVIEVAWSPDGSRLAFVAWWFDPDPEGSSLYELWTVDADGGNLMKLASADFIRGIGWRPNSSARSGIPSIAPGGIVSAAGTPLVRPIAANSIFSLYGTEFTPTGTSVVQPELDELGHVSSVLNGTCVEINGQRAPLFAVLPGQINLQSLPHLAPGTASAVVIRGCDEPEEERSAPVSFQVAAAQPAFFNFVNNPDGVNPIAALHGSGPDPIGPTGLFTTTITTPASPGEFVSLYATGLGATSPSFAAGEIPGTGASVVGSVAVNLGGIELTPGEIPYAGVAPCCAGLYQVVIRIPDDAPDGNLPVIISIDGTASPEGPFIAVEN